MASNQYQQTSAGSVSNQAGRDIILHGVPIEQVQQIALDVYRTNALDLRDLAAEVALGRAERITNDFLQRMQEEHPERIQNLSDPDMARTLFQAQNEFACSGEEDLEAALVDLLVDRAGQTDRSLLTLVLNEAIQATPKLTQSQRSAIAAAFLVRYVRYAGPLNLESYYENFVLNDLIRLSRNLPTKQSEFQHIEYVGAGSLSVVSASVIEALKRGSENFFMKGFAKQELEVQLDEQAIEALFVASLRDAGRLQFMVSNQEELETSFANLSLPEDARQALRTLFSGQVMDDSAVRAEVESRFPGIADFSNSWQDTSLKSLTLTSVGLAIGHGYWRRITGKNAPLSIWI